MPNYFISKVQTAVFESEQKAYAVSTEMTIDRNRAVHVTLYITWRPTAYAQVGHLVTAVINCRRIILKIVRSKDANG